MTHNVSAIVLAAGQGTRMRSATSKVLHTCAGLPLIGHVVRLALGLGANAVVVVVSPSNHAQVQAALQAIMPDAPLTYAIQTVAKGTGDAVRAGLEKIPESTSHAVILSGDVPLLTPQTMAALKAAGTASTLALLTCQVSDPTGYGRIVRDAHNAPCRIVEHKDASAQQRAISEVNVGVYWGEVPLLRRAVGALTTDNAQAELYLTDVVATAAQSGTVAAVPVGDADEMRGINSRVQLGEVERIMRARLVRHHQDLGVTFEDPKNVFIGPDVVLAQDVHIGPGVQLRGHTHIGAGTCVEGPSVILDSRIASDVTIRAFCHLEDADLASGATVGPYARLRPKARLAANVRIGNFVEVKNAHMGEGAKANHLAYVGDADIGAGANLGAGTIVCNYDGFNKNRTHVGAKAFIGSNSTLVAPLRIGDGAFVAAGSTITEDVPAEALAFGRARQAVREGHAKVLRERLAAIKAGKKGAESAP
jgi:bifunctional UDP-N-acetylglucosamine pyrophosphorylase/glucosamine-1-phosphate N-acetyltransferase